MRKHCLIALIVAIVATPAGAEELLVDRIREMQGDSGPVDIPRGRTMEQVKDNRGEPDNVQGPVGEPPITRWVYDGFTVYFEKDRVIHAVVKR
jgi:hypothetical protein